MQATAPLKPVRAPAGAHSAPDDGIAELAAACKACADPLRLQILRALHNDSLAVSELCELLGVRQPALSHHLKVLARAGLVTSRREGTSIFYRRSDLLAPVGGAAVAATLLAELDTRPLPPAMRRGLARLQRVRERNSRDFFRLNADKFREQQDLIASYDQYAETVAQLLREAPLPRRELALEIGPGDGRFLSHLAPRFTRVMALDNSPEMLAASRLTAATAELDNVEFLLGDTGSPDLADLAADCVVINMVLHHTPEPARVLADAAAHLAPGGVVAVADLCRHEQGWARESCGDLWLGFAPEQLTAWAAAAALDDIASSFLTQRNGFQIQVHLFGRATH